MAAMSENDRIHAWAGYIRQLGDGGVDLSTVLDATRAALDAADDWVDGSTADYNTALPEPFRSWATAQQKALLLVYVVLRRYDAGV